MGPHRVLTGGCSPIAAELSPLLATDPVYERPACPGAADGGPHAKTPRPQGAAGDGARELPGGGPGAGGPPECWSEGHTLSGKQASIKN